MSTPTPEPAAGFGALDVLAAHGLSERTCQQLHNVGYRSVAELSADLSRMESGVSYDAEFLTIPMTPAEFEELRQALAAWMVGSTLTDIVAEPGRQVPGAGVQDSSAAQTRP